jgi:hypothetical protein
MVIQRGRIRTAYRIYEAQGYQPMASYPEAEPIVPRYCAPIKNAVMLRLPVRLGDDEEGPTYFFGCTEASSVLFLDRC